MKIVRLKLILIGFLSLTILGCQEHAKITDEKSQTSSEQPKIYAQTTTGVQPKESDIFGSGLPGQ